MYHLRPLLIILITILCVPIISHAADLFSSRQEKEGLLKALRQKDPQYDPAEKMLRGRFSSPGYHTPLKSGYVHRTRNSLQYAVALLDSGQPDRLKRAKDILRAQRDKLEALARSLLDVETVERAEFEALMA